MLPLASSATRGSTTADSAISCMTSCTGWTFLAGAVQAVCNGLSMSAAQSTTVHHVHDGLLHPHLKHCSSAASAVRRLPSAVRTATPAFGVRSSGLFCGRPGGLELVPRLPARSVTFLWQFSPGPESFFSRSTSTAHTEH